MPVDKTPMPREYGEMIYSLLNELNGVVIAQMRTVNNSIANMQRLILDSNAAINSLITSLQETRDKRYQEEIEQLEVQMKMRDKRNQEEMELLRKQLDEKRLSKGFSMTTSEKIEAVTTEVLEKRELEQHRHHKIDWVDLRNKVILVVITAIVMTIYNKIVNP
jgi:hypothetical protein